MTTNENEYLSALMDGEISGVDLDWALQKLADDPEALARITRYQLARDVLNSKLSVAPQIDLRGRIADAIAEEPTPTLAIEPAATKDNVVPLRRNTWWKQATGLAMAASLGALVMVGVMPDNDSQSGMMLAAAEKPNNNGTRWTVGAPEVASRLDHYLVDHSEYSGAPGAFSSARVVVYGEE